MMRSSVRDESDAGLAAESAIVTYTRVLPGSARGPAKRQEPFFDAEEVPPVVGDLRVDDMDRVMPSDKAPRVRRRGARGAVLIGAVALAIGMVVLAYAYGIATRVGSPPTAADASATAPASTARLGAGTAPDTALAPASNDTAALPPAGSDAASPTPAPAQAEPPQPRDRPQQAAHARVAEPVAPGSDGVPMDGDAALPDAGAQPALVAPVPTTAMPTAPNKVSPSATARIEPPPPTNAPPSDAKPAGSGDDLMVNIERLLTRDGATAATAASTPLAPAPAASDALPPLPDPNTVAVEPPPADVGAQTDSRLIPPADIPNVPPVPLRGATGIQ